MNHHKEDTYLIKPLVDRILPSESIRVERVTGGVSTYVYRISYSYETFYLRILPEEGMSFAPEVAVHTKLRQMHVKVPEVIYFNYCYEPLQRSVMVTTEIKGHPVCESLVLEEDQLKAILIEAGRDLARINTIMVEGFGWMKRDWADTTHLCAQWPDHRAFALECWEIDLAYLAENALHASEIAALEQIISRYNSWLAIEQGYLAHGDFDTTHIFQDNGQYTGIIDFGEIRGTSRCYDLGHFHIRDGEQLPYQLLPALLHGYKEIISLSSTYEQQIRFTSILINVRALVRSLQKRPPNRSTQHQLDVLREDIATFL